MVNIVYLDTNLVSDPSANFTLLNVIPAKQSEYDTFSTKANVKRKQARRSVEIDQDVTDAIRKQFGNIPIARAIRLLVGLKPKVAQDAWQGEEDAVIREHYPSMGGAPLANLFGRSRPCVCNRARKLGVKRVFLYKRDRRGQKGKP